MLYFLLQMNLRVSLLSVLLVGSAVVAMVAAAAQSRNNDNRNKRQSRGGGAEHCDPAFCRIPVSHTFTLLLAQSLVQDPTRKIKYTPSLCLQAKSSE